MHRPRRGEGPQEPRGRADPQSRHSGAHRGAPLSRRWKMMSPCWGTPRNDPGLGRYGGPSRAAPQMAAQPIALTAVSAAAPQWGVGPLFLPTFCHRGRGAKLWTEGEKMEERDPGVSGEQELGTAGESEQNQQGRGEKHWVGTRTNYFPIRKRTSFLPNYSPKFLLPHSEQDCFICQWVLATGGLNRPAPRCCGHIQLPINRDRLAGAGKGGWGHPLCVGRAPPSHTPLHLAPARQSGGCCAGTHSFALGASNEPSPKRGEPCMPPPSRQCREGWRRRSAPGGDTALAPSAAWPAAAVPCV